MLWRETLRACSVSLWAWTEMECDTGCFKWALPLFKALFPSLYLSPSCTPLPPSFPPFSALRTPPLTFVFMVKVTMMSLPLFSQLGPCWHGRSWGILLSVGVCYSGTTKCGPLKIRTPCAIKTLCLHKHYFSTHVIRTPLYSGHLVCACGVP